MWGTLGGGFGRGGHRPHAPMASRPTEVTGHQ